jgi:hypothetical protein
MPTDSIEREQVALTEKVLARRLRLTTFEAAPSYVEPQAVSLSRSNCSWAMGLFRPPSDIWEPSKTCSMHPMTRSSFA